MLTEIGLVEHRQMRGSRGMMPTEAGRYTCLEQRRAIMKTSLNDKQISVEQDDVLMVSEQGFLYPSPDRSGETNR